MTIERSLGTLEEFHQLDAVAAAEEGIEACRSGDIKEANRAFDRAKSAVGEISKVRKLTSRVLRLMEQLGVKDLSPEIILQTLQPVEPIEPLKVEEPRRKRAERKIGKVNFPEKQARAVSACYVGAEEIFRNTDLSLSEAWTKAIEEEFADEIKAGEDVGITIRRGLIFTARNKIEEVFHRLSDGKIEIRLPFESSSLRKVGVTDESTLELFKILGELFPGMTFEEFKEATSLKKAAEREKEREEMRALYSFSEEEAFYLSGLILENEEIFRQKVNMPITTTDIEVIAKLFNSFGIGFRISDPRQTIQSLERKLFFANEQPGNWEVLFRANTDEGRTKLLSLLSNTENQAFLRELICSPAKRITAHS